MGVTSAVQWWGEWQLHVLALGSLVIQYLLCISAGFRPAPISQRFRFFIWLCFLGSDAVAIYALATLFNRQRNQQLQQSAHRLQVFWAPILLMHLGGLVVITAYNVEDNELWRRHVFTALSQVTVVFWVLYKSWGSSLDTKRDQAAAVLLFIAGIIKCLERPWALKSACFHSLANSCGPAKRSASREDELEKYVEQARAFVLSEDVYWSNRTKLFAPEMLFIDFTYPYCDRLTNLKSFFVRGEEEAYSSLRDGLLDIFKVLYTRKKTSSFKDDTANVEEEESCSGFIGMVNWGFCKLLLLLSYFLVSGDEENQVDENTTIALLFGTSMLETIAPKILNCFNENQWPATVAQHNVIGYFARNRRHTMLMGFARFFQCKDLLDQYWSMESQYTAVDITKLVHQHVRDGWKEYIKDAASYREFNDMRGQWTLVRESCEQSLGWSLEKPFDESILLWHMATDFCFHLMGTTRQDDECRSTEISNYMMHLLFRNPDMLMAGSRSNLFKTAYDELEEILKGESTASCKAGVLSKKISDKLKSNEVARESFIYDAWVLAERLMDLGDETKMWKVIQGVWLEMLCFSASRCRGYLHAKCLGSGGEYLSFVWLLLAHTGMETFSERIQRTMSIHLLKHKREQQLQNTHALSTSQGEGTVPMFDEIVVLQ